MEKSKNIIDRIKEENIQPIPRWQFASKNILVWIAFAISTLIGAAAFSVILFSIRQTDFDLASHLSHSGIELFLGLLPFFWIIALLIFLVLAIFSIQKSKKAYKLSRTTWVVFSTAISILLGTLFFIGGGAQWLENSFADQVSIYESLEDKKKKVWMNPEDGFLSGTIEIVSGDALKLVDFNNKEWGIDYEGAFISPAVLLEKGEQVKLIGGISGPASFKADELRPWGGFKQGMKRQGRGKGRLKE